SLNEVRTLLLVGGDALEAVLGLSQISLYHGSVLTAAEAEAIRRVCPVRSPRVERLPPKLHSIVVTLHPAFALRGKPQFRPMIQTTIARAARWADQEEPPTRPPAEHFNLEASVDEVEEFL